MRELTPQEALARAAGLCATKELCSSDIRKRLQSWLIAPQEHASIIETLIGKGFINHARYARSFVHDKSLYSKWGVKKIEFTLRAKQIEPDIIAAALQDIAPDQQQETLHKILIGKLKQLKESDTYQRNQKLMRLGLSRGFSYELIRKEIARIEPNFEEIDNY